MIVTRHIETLPDLSLVNTAVFIIPIGCIMFFILQKKGIIKTGPGYNNRLAAIIATLVIIGTIAVNIMVTSGYKELYSKFKKLELTSEDYSFSIFTVNNSYTFCTFYTELPEEENSYMIYQIPVEKIKYAGDNPDDTVYKKSGSDTIFSPEGNVYVIKRQSTLF